MDDADQWVTPITQGEIESFTEIAAMRNWPDWFVHGVIRNLVPRLIAERRAPSNADVSRIAAALGEQSLWPLEDNEKVVRIVLAALGRAPSDAEVRATKAERRYERLLASFSDLQSCAQHVVDETDRIHDGDPWPTKYRAPYAAITTLRSLLLGQYGLRVLAQEPKP